MEDFNSESDSDYTSYWRDWATLEEDEDEDKDKDHGSASASVYDPTHQDNSTPILSPSTVSFTSSASDLLVGNRSPNDADREHSEHMTSHGIVGDRPLAESGETTPRLWHPPVAGGEKRVTSGSSVEPIYIYVNSEGPESLWIRQQSPKNTTTKGTADNIPSKGVTHAIALKMRKGGGYLAASKEHLLYFGPLGQYLPKFRHEFISSRGNEYFCEIDEDYLTDRFNLTGLNTDVQYYQYALDLVTDVFDLDCDDEMREQIEKSARHLYGLVHARYITTTRGLAKMLEKYKKGDFGKCPRVDCKSGHLLPTGMADVPSIQFVKLYCAKCEDLYNPKSTRHSNIDGAYFGSSFQNILFQVYPALVPEKSIARYEPKVFGFKVHAAAALQRWQGKRREEMQQRLKVTGLDNPFVLPAESVDGEVDEAEDDGGLDGEGMEIGDDVVAAVQ